MSKSVFTIAVIIMCAGCAQGSGPSAEVLGATIRDAGLRCTEVSSAEAMPDRENTWRVTCTDSLVYAATLEESGELCLETIIAGGFSGDLILPPDPRCAPLSGAE